jgi:hypothetical protein
VLVGVDDDAQIHVVDGGIPISDPDFAGEVVRSFGKMSLLDSFK